VKAIGGRRMKGRARRRHGGYNRPFPQSTPIRRAGGYPARRLCNPPHTFPAAAPDALAGLLALGRCRYRRTGPRVPFYW
jgi:hypothetical protein